jgi:colanic acid/amylovoran biosynthesis glycosyltransferase
MHSIAYIANQFPVAVEPYVWQEIIELRQRGSRVVPCSVRYPAFTPECSAQKLEQETLYLLPVRFGLIVPATWLLLRNVTVIADFLLRALVQGTEPLSRRLRALGNTWLGAYYALLLRRASVQHIHSHHGYSASWVAMVAARLLGVGFSMTLHGSDLLLHRSYLDTKLANCKFCVTVSKFNRDHILEESPSTPADSVIVQRVGVDTSFQTLPSHTRDDQSALLMLAVGRLHRVKNHEFLIKACRELKLLGIRFICLIVGEGPERPALERLIHKLGLEEEVRLFGYVPRQRLDSYYAMCDLVVLTSHSEGLPLVLMEAMAHGKTVVAPLITGIPELVVPGKTGFLYEPDCVDDFVAKVKVVSLAQAELAPMRREARRHVLQHFNRATNLSAFADLFLARIQTPILEAPRHENPVLQQVQL